MRVGICDDDRLIHQEIMELCEEFFKIYGIEGNVYSYFSGEEVMKDCLELQLLILDVEMNGLSGIEVKAFFEEKYKRTAILFMTSHREQMQNAFGPNVYGFLVKPVEKEKFFSSLKRIITLISWNKKVELETGQWIDSSDILYIESDHNYSSVVIEGEKHYIVIKSLSQWEKELKSYGFFRVAHSYLVNMERIEQIVENKIAKVVRISGEEIAVARRRWKEFKTAYREYCYARAR